MTAAFREPRGNVVQGSFLPLPRNMPAAERAAKTGGKLAVSFAGSLPWPLPAVYCDVGRRYDWSFLDRHTAPVVIVVPGHCDTRDALRQILERCDRIRVGYPLLIDLSLREMGYVIDRPGNRLDLWPIKRHTAIWAEYFRGEAT